MKKFPLRWYFLVTFLITSLFGNPIVQYKSAAAQIQTLTFVPSADSYVQQAYPTTNAGTNSKLRTDGSPIVNSYLRFKITGVNGRRVVSARLRLYATSSSSPGYQVRSVANTTWSETGITYSNAPAMGSVLRTSTAITANTWISLDVTELVKGDGSISLALTTTSSTNTTYSAHEAGATAPQLVLSIEDIASTAAPTTTSQPTVTPPAKTPTPIPTPTPAPGNPAVIYATGDLTRCKGVPVTPTNNAWIVSNMLLNTSGPIFSLGDNSNDNGTASDYANCFDPTWGRSKARIRPAMGNHDQISDPQGAPYFAYFGANAHPEQAGHYSMDIGAWHIVVLNSDCAVGNQGCGDTSAQTNWLKGDLALHPNFCTLAIFHTPYFTSGSQSAYTAMLSFWKVLYQNHVDVIINGHNHLYERFAPQDPYGTLDPVNGIREFVVGTGGASVDSTTKAALPNEEVRSWSAFGYLKLSLWPDRYDWQFVQQPGKTFSDSGTTNCH